MKFMLIDNESAERALTIEALRSRFGDVGFVEIAGKQDFEVMAAQADFELVITEYQLGWTDGLRLLKTLKSRFPCIPIIMFTASGNEEVAVKGMKAGLADYIPKHQRQHLAEAIDRCLPRMGLRSPCRGSEQHVRLCKKWDLAISRLTSDFAYAMRVEPDGSMVREWVTEPYTRITGYGAKETDNASVWLVPVYPDDLPIFCRHIENLLAGRQDVSEYRIIARDGETLWLRDHALPVRDKITKRVARIYGAAQDITRRRKAEDGLRLTQRALDSSNNGIIITGPAEADYPIIYANPAFLHITGYSFEELLGRNPRFLQVGDYDQPELEELRTALREQRQGYSVLRNYRKDGELFWNEVYIAPVTNEEGKTTHYVGVQNDVTRRVRMEAQLLNSESQTRSILDNVLDGIITIDDQGIVENFNPAAEKIFGYAATDVIGRNVSMLMPKPDHGRHNTYLANYLRTGERKIIGVGREVVGRKKNGNRFPMELGVSEIQSDQRRLFIGVVHDLTERKRTEKALHELSSHLQSVREEERSRIAREIHDELGSMLAALKMDVSWLAKKLPEKAPAQREKAVSMNRMIDEAIETVRKITTALRPSILDNLGLLAAIEWQVQEFCEHSGIKCELTLPPETDVSLDGEQVTAVFRILQEALTNIILHSEASQAKVEVQIRNGELVMKVMDNGRGTTARQQASPQSFGILGMHERALHFGGVLHISSHAGAGTEIVLYMPLISSKAEAGDD